MKLLFDQNLPPSLVRRLADLFPESAHVRDIGLARASDDAVWRHAEQHGMTIVTRDADYHDLVMVRGAPPHVVWLRLGNASVSVYEAALRDCASTIQALPNGQQFELAILPAVAASEQ